MPSGLQNGRLDLLSPRATPRLGGIEMESFKQHIQIRWSDLDPNGHLRGDKLCTTLNLNGAWLN